MMDGWMDGWIDGWMDGWMCLAVSTEYQCVTDGHTDILRRCSLRHACMIVLYVFIYTSLFTIKIVV